MRKVFSLMTGLLLPLALLLGSSTAALAQPVADQDIFQQNCIFPLDPIPSGSTGRPSAPFPGADHPFLHSSTHLQGNRANTKWAGGLLFTPTLTIPEFRDYSSAVVVDNPDPTRPARVYIDYFDHAGTMLTNGPYDIAAEGFYVEAATPLGLLSGVGSARVRSVPNAFGETVPIVGASLLQTPCLYNSSGALAFCDQDSPPPGAVSMQQLQRVQSNKTRLWWGPLTQTELSTNDFFHGQLPFFWVVNPNSVGNQVQVDLFIWDRVAGALITGGPIPWRTINLPPNGALFEKSGSHLTAAPIGLFDQLLNSYSTLNPDWDVLVRVTSIGDPTLPDSDKVPLPILGDGVMTDFFGIDTSTSPPALVGDGSRFRQASTMLANTPQVILINPDFSYQPGGIVATYMGISNTGTVNAGPIQVQYFNNNGGLVSTGTIASLAPKQSARIEPGVFGYPTGTVGFGWVRIIACKSTLVGWSVRETTPTGGFQFHKVYGETLTNINANEPGNGFQITNAAGTFQRKAIPFARVDTTFYWPGYSTFVNASVSNVGNWFYRFFDGAGAEVTNLAGMPFLGLPWGRTAPTYEDPQVLFPFFGNITGRVDITTGNVRGIDVIGDPLNEYNIPNFPGGGSQE
jgi:hypothetical protein